MHPEARHFLDYCKAVFAAWYEGTTVLDVGSGDINGNNRHYFARGTYVGCDIAEGPNVDVVCPCHLLPFGPGSFDVIISTECLEHDMHYPKTLAKIVDLLRPGGLFVMTCASTGRAEHGTMRCHSTESFTTRLSDEWRDYYRNLTAQDVRDVMDVGAGVFAYHRFYYNARSHDLYFVGVKAGAPEWATSADPPQYGAPGVARA
ncbi:MAG: class I SAM-dependent methyltransferase [Actinobacteria bacterium]|nr:class I SAM-dependent methyltransferase [Actinomycetota bacterium]